MHATSGKSNRRGLLIAVGAAVAIWGGGAAFRQFGARRFDFDPIPDLPGFRQVEGGTVTSTALSDPLIGLDTGRPPAPWIKNHRICSALFRSHRSGTVPVASFSDYYCPYCRVLTRELSAREAAGEITVTWHELPLLGEASVIAARAAMAADLQGGYSAFHARLMRAQFRPDPAYLAELGESAGLNVDRLLADMSNPSIDTQLQLTAGVAARFGFYGTPALVVGRTAVLGAIPVPRLNALIALEASDPEYCS